MCVLNDAQHIISGRAWQVHMLYNESAMEGCRIDPSPNY